MEEENKDTSSIRHDQDPYISIAKYRLPQGIPISSSLTGILKWKQKPSDLLNFHSLSFENA